MQTPRKYSEAFNISNYNIYDKNRLIQTQSNHQKYTSNIGMFHPNTPIFNKTITNYQITPTHKLNSRSQLHQQFYDRNGKNNTNAKTQDTFNIQESNANRMSATYSFNSTNQKYNNFNDFYYQKRASRPVTPSQQSYAQQNSQHQIVNNGNRYSNSFYKYTQNQSYVSDIDRSRKSNSVGKRGKFLTVVSRMPVCKKPIPIHNF